MKHVYDDGGRKLHGYKGTAGDCVVRAICIAAMMPYDEVYERMAHGMGTQRQTKRAKSGARSARNGVSVKRKWFKEYMTALGYKFVPTMGIGTGCKVHMRADELPKGRLIVSLSKHYAAVIDGVLRDTYDCSRDGTRCVYGYWISRD